MTKVLLVEDDDVDAHWVRRALAPCEGVDDVDRAGSLAEARHLLAQKTHDALVVDLTLPDADPRQTLPALLAGYQHLPVVVLTGCLDDEFASAAIATGVQDYLIKGEAGPGALRRALRFALARSQRHAQIQAMALRDSLTGVANRQEFERRLDQLLEQRDGADETLLGVCLVDVDEFKAVNDSRGHAFGDSVLQAIAKLLETNVRRSDTVARLGGDEFVVIFNELRGLNHAGQLMDRLYDSLAQGLQIGGEHVGVKLSTGLAIAPVHGESRADLLDAADRAMYEAKRAGRGRWSMPDYPVMQATPAAAGAH